jgi:probable phosphoglycerate mutase
MAVTLYVTRHGETVANTLSRYTGSTDSPLTDLGRKQAMDARQRLERLGIQEAQCSPLGRARETASLMLDGLNIPTVVDDRLREIDVGPMEGMTHADAVRLYPQSKPFMERPSAYVAPDGAEPTEVLLGRVQSFLQDAALREGRTLLAVTHGYTMRAFNACAVGDGTLRAMDHSPRYGSAQLVCYVYERGRWREKHTAVSLYLVRHGKTVWNEQQRIQGWGDSPLTDEGREQARRLGERIRALTLDVAHSSPSSRALTTARIALEQRPIPLVVDDRLRERGMGILEGVTLEQARALHSGFANYETAPGGETVEALRHRLTSYLHDAAQGYSAAIIAFSHALSIRWLQAIALDDGTHAAFLRTGWLDNSTLTHLRCVDGAWGEA